MRLLPGTQIWPQGTTAAIDPTLAGEVVEDELIPFGDASAGVTGELQSSVVRVASGTLDFTFRVRAISGGEIVNLNWQFFGIVPSIDMEYRLDGLGDVGPVTIYRTDWAMAGEATLVQLDHFFQGLREGVTSRFVTLKTDATTYTRAQAFGMTEPLPGRAEYRWGCVAEGFVPAP